MPALRFCNLLIIIALLVSGCKKEKGPFISPVPKIGLIEIRPDSVKEFQQQVSFLIDYTDGDGDIGFDHPDSLSLIIRDRRITEADTLHVQPVAPPNSSIAVQGTLSISLNSTFLIGNGDAEKTSFEIRLRDRQNNWSNTVNSSEITVYR